MSDVVELPEQAGATGGSTAVTGAGVQSVDRALGILEVLARTGESGVTELALELGVHKSTAFRLVATLEAHRLVEQTSDRGRYRLGMGILRLAGATTARLDLVQEARPISRQLAADTGAPVDFRGITVGEVVRIGVDYLPDKAKIDIPVEIRYFPDRMHSRARERTAELSGEAFRVAVDRFVARGFRAQLRTGNLVTGQLYVALDFFPGTRRVKLDFSQSPVEIPTVPGSLEDLQQTITLIAKKLDRLPLEEIGANLNRTVQDVNRLVKRFDTEVTPEARDALAEGRQTLADASRALSSIERSAAPDGRLAQELEERGYELYKDAPVPVS